MVDVVYLTYPMVDCYVTYPTADCCMHTTYSHTPHSITINFY